MIKTLKGTCRDCGVEHFTETLRCCACYIRWCRREHLRLGCEKRDGLIPETEFGAPSSKTGAVATAAKPSDLKVAYEGSNPSPASQEPKEERREE